MSRAEVRRAVFNWFSGNASVSPGTSPTPGLTSFFRALPNVTDGYRILADAATPDDPAPMWGAAWALHIAEESEHRRAIGGAHSGKKRIDYTVLIRVAFRSVIGDPAEGDLNPAEVAMDHYDDVIEALKTRLRANRNLGVDSIEIFQAGEGGESLAPDIVLTSEAPLVDEDGPGLWLFGWLQFQVVQWATT